MRLTKLTLNGFKSFADATEFTFDDAITGIVGPNGCGKSNVVDAIKWVLGERSSKSLRGTEMLDCIFAGSGSRKPSGMASVRLSFDNPLLKTANFSHAVDTNTADDQANVAGNGEAADEPSLVDARLRGRRGLPFDADVVEVERQLYRDGTSHYLINNKKARLKDIRDLFLDTGIGADAYSIIEQGKVDAMLLASPQERRTIFEEAAGVAKYKMRRVEAQRKLERTETNLTSTREQLESTDRRLKMVRGQAAKARRFKDLDSEYRAWRLSLAFEQYDELRQRLDGLTSRQADLHTQKEAAASKLAEFEQEKQEVELQRQEALSNQRRVEQDRQSAEHQFAQATQRLEMTNRAAQEAQQQLAVDQERLTGLEAAAKATDVSITDQRETIGTVAEQAATAEKYLSDANAVRAESLSAIGEARDRVSRRRSAIQQIDRERAALNASSQSELRRAETIKEQADRLESKAAGLGGEAEKFGALAAAATQAIAGLDSLIKETVASIAQLDDQISKLSEDRRGLASRVTLAQQESLKLKTRQSTLLEMDQNRAGFGDAVRHVLDTKAGKSGFASVQGVLADCIEATTEHAAHAGLVEAALGPALQAILVEKLADLPTSEELASLPGRVTFMTAAGPDEQPGSLQVHDFGGSDLPADRVFPLRNAIKARAGSAIDSETINRVLDRLLGATYLVESLDSALLLSALHTRNARFITRDGTILEADGRVHTGPAGPAEAGGVLQRRAELDALKLRTDELDAALAIEQDALKNADTEASSLSQTVSALRQSLNQAQRNQTQEHNKLDRAVADAERIARERRSIDDEVMQLRDRCAKVEADRQALIERGESLKRLHDEELLNLQKAENEVLSLQASADAATETVAQKRVDVGRLAEQLASARKELNRLQLAKDEQGRQLRDLARHIEQAQSRGAEHTATIERSKQQIVESQTAIESLAGVVQAAASACLQFAHECSEMAEKVQIARQHAQHHERDWNALELDKRELEVKRETLEERALSDLSIDLPGNYVEYREVMETDVKRIDPAIAIKEIDTLRVEIKKLGNVNLDSIEEETLLAAQNDDLIKQVADLDDARVKLSELILQLNDVSRNRFEEVFTRIQENFGGPDGMFRRMFGGGRAEVRLMPLIKEINGEKVQTDIIDVLESGIEVIAKPPGKEPRSISQLSGGEKTLTAVALLMSIFRSKPSCFCILDEVDAALDEGNVGRYNHVIRQFTDMSHFIVITHNKRTMQSADRLYGVTMQERGVSKRVSVKFDEIAKDGSIKQSAIDNDAAEKPAPPKTAPVEVAHPVAVAAPIEELEAVTLEPITLSVSTPAAPASMEDDPKSSLKGALQRALASMRASADAKSEAKADGAMDPAQN